MYTENDLVKIAKRENNSKRNYLIVNPLQGKHIPVRPHAALSLFGQLADLILSAYTDEKILMIGFAETATAIGAAAAIRIGAPYIHTTRETVAGAGYLSFSETHSHAVTQKIVKNEIGQMIYGIDRIVFVEDEVTTGNTIWNSICALRKEYGTELSFSVASIINGMDEKARGFYEEEGIQLHYCLRTDHQRYAYQAQQCSEDGIYHACNTSQVHEPVIESWKNVGKGPTESTQICDARRARLPAAESGKDSGKEAAESGKDSGKRSAWTAAEVSIAGAVDARTLTDAKAYERSCHSLWEEVRMKLGGWLEGNVLVLGTEEFMYPALYVAAQIERLGANVRFHATTRSPICVSASPDAPLHERYELRSMYEEGRVTYVYDIAYNDTILVITDADNAQTAGRNSLFHALEGRSRNLFFIRWVKK